MLFSYEAKHAARVELRNGTTVVEESTAATGSFAVTPEATTDYTIVAFNRLGAASSPASVSAYVLPPTIQLQVSHQAVVRGAEPVTVSWTTTQTESLQIPGYAELVPHTFQDIRSLGPAADVTAALRAGSATLEDAWTTFSIPFTISKFGQEFQHVTVSTNGWFGLPEGVDEEDAPNGHFTSSVAGNPTSFPSTSASNKNTFGVYWDDLEGHANGKVQWTIVGRAPERTLVIQWTDFQYWHSSNYRKSSMTFQGRISEQGEVEYFYGPMRCLDCDNGDEGRERGTSATIAYNRDSTEGVAAIINKPVTLSNRKITFVEPRIVTGAEAVAGSFSFLPVGASMRFHATSGPTTTTADVQLNVFEKGDLFISEVHPFPATGETEWIELRNVSGATLSDLRGLRVTNAAGESFTLDKATGTISLSHSNLWNSDTPFFELKPTGGDYAYGSSFQIGDTEDTLTLWAGANPLFQLRYDASFGVVQGRSVALDPHVRSIALVEPARTAAQGGWWCLGRTTMDSAATAYLKPTPGLPNMPCYDFVETVGVPYQTTVGAKGTVDVLQPLDQAIGYRNNVTLPPGFRFFYDGREYDSFSVHRNGFMSLGSASGGISGAINDLVYNDPPSATLFDDNPSTSTDMYTGRLPTFTIMPFWDDLVPVTSSSLQVHMTHDAANGRLIFEWAGIRPDSTTTGVGELRFQVHLVKRPAGNDGIEFHYGPLNAQPGATCKVTSTTGICNGSSATSGVMVHEDDRSRAMTLFRRSTSTTTLNVVGNSKRVLTGR